MKRKILIIGYGDIAKRHHKNIIFLLPKSEIKIFTRKNYIKKNLNFLKTLKEAKNYKPDITLICSPANTHLKYAKIFSKLNSNIFVEKPLATNSDDLKKFINYIKNKKITILTGYNLRFDQSFIFFQKIIKLKKIGNILSVRSEVGQYLPSWRNKIYSKTVSANKSLGGGVVNELSHDVDILLLLFKKLKLIYGISLSLSNLKINVEDSAHAIFKSSQNRKNFYLFLNLDFYRHDNTRTCTVIGSNGTIKWDGVQKSVTHHIINKKNPKIYKFNKNKNYSYLKEMKFFLYNIRKKKTLHNDLKTNYKLIKILELMKKNKR